jgi:hypothetical protein
LWLGGNHKRLRAKGGTMNRFAWALIPALMSCVANGPESLAGSSLGTECKNGFNTVKAEINSISDPAKKQQAQTLARGAFTDLKSGEYQNCMDKLKQIKALVP